MPLQLLMLKTVLLTSLLLRLHATQASSAKQGCQETCGNITIPYPFGIGAGCYLNDSFQVFCNGLSQDRPLRFTNNNEFPILEISVDSVRVVDESIEMCKSTSTGASLILDQHYQFSEDGNIYVAVGCNISTVFIGNQKNFECDSLCTEETPIIGLASNCTGLNGCCQGSIRENLNSYLFMTTSKNLDSNACVNAFIAEKSASITFGKALMQFPVALNWVVALDTCHQASQRGDGLCGKNSDCVDSTKGQGYNCRCKQGYQGNPYLSNGCQAGGETCVKTTGSEKCISRSRHKLTVSDVVVIATVIGLSVFGATGYLAYLMFDRIKKNKIKKKFFEKNGGHLLKKKISSNKSCVTRMKIYTAKDMVKATNNFNRSMFLGKGGHGTVYKGLLPDKTLVAIKKSNVADQTEQIVNEIFILAHINHRNIVKLLGCCLEYEVPLLVYEYLANNTLLHHLHDGAEISKFSWKDRIRIAKEVAGALFYLHSYTSPSIFHRDIKPSNILLDENYRAVVSDFGLSRSIALSKTHVTTQIEGTFGYLDPEYFQSGQLTAKSDVYSFGVVIIELLTRKKSISSSEFGEGLVPRFKYLMKHDRVIDILDKQVLQEAIIDDVFSVAKLAKRCIKNKGQKRPCMKEVVIELDKLSEPYVPKRSYTMIEPELILELKKCNKHEKNG